MFRAGEKVAVIMEYVVEHCKHKVIARLNKLAAAFSKNDIWKTPNIFRIDDIFLQGQDDRGLLDDKYQTLGVSKQAWPRVLEI